MDRSKLILAGVAAVSILMNAVFAGIAVRVWIRSSDETTAVGVLFTLPGDLRADLRTAMSQEDSRIALAQTELRQSRSQLQALLAEERPELQALQLAFADVREKTVRLQTELHAVIFSYYATTSQQ